MRITDLKDKKCLVTGAASGIGKAVAIAAAREGAELFLTDINAAALEAVAAQIRADGGRVSACQAMDIADFAAVKKFADEIHAQSGSLDILMNIAGIAVWGEVDKLEHRQWKKTIDVNLMGPVHVMEAFLPAMIAAGKGGHLVNVSSAAGLFGLPMHAAYSASKFGLRGISEVLRFDLRRHGIGVSLVCPGGVDTGLVNTVEIQGVDIHDPELISLRRHFQKRAVSPAKAAAAILGGIKANRYMVFTSPDIRVGYWFQRKFAWPYELVMRLLNDRLYAVLRRQAAKRR
ncbi:MAG TPA: SDR family oxidoreductase [Stenotrophobium sp.]|jgi:NAD(P)-dependent dehydrogenase (short-subunit alcohol dehydrogenase family)|nr:SDR family oxidoreductase [Stenotrophobium sp.]